MFDWFDSVVETVGGWFSSGDSDVTQFDLAKPNMDGGWDFDVSDYDTSLGDVSGGIGDTLSEWGTAAYKALPGLALEAGKSAVRNAPAFFSSGTSAPASAGRASAGNPMMGGPGGPLDPTPKWKKRAQTTPAFQQNQMAQNPLFSYTQAFNGNTY